MTDVARTFLDKSRQLLSSDYLPKIERSLDALRGDADAWWRPNEASNSIANLMLHLSGNVGQWIVGGVGLRDHERDRQLEFADRSRLPRRELLDMLRSTLGEADDVLQQLSSAALLERRQIQRYDVTVLEAIYHVVEHFGMHTGQIIMLSKMQTGEDLRLWIPPDEQP